MMGIETGYYERYCRKGLSHHMSFMTPIYERALAICADDIILEWEQKRYIAIFTGRDNAGANILADLEADVMRLTRARVQLSGFEAEKYCFHEELQSSLTHHFTRIEALLQSRAFQETEQSATMCYLAKVKQMLNPMLEPWYRFDVLFRITDGKPMFVLGDMLGHLALTRETVGEWSHAKKVNYMLDYYRLKNIYRHVERIRTALVNGGRNLREEDWYFAEIFREFLETGDETKLPFIKSGLEKKREQSVSDFRKEKLYSCNGDCGCAFDGMEKEEVQQHKFRKSLAPKARDEREQIKQAFVQHKERGTEDRNKGSGDGGSGIPIELILSMLQGQGNAGAGIPASPLMSTPNGSPIAGSPTIKSTEEATQKKTQQEPLSRFPVVAASGVGGQSDINSGVEARLAERRIENEKLDETRRAVLLDEAVTFFNDLHFKPALQVPVPEYQEPHCQPQPPARRQHPLRQKQNRARRHDGPLIPFGDWGSEPGSPLPSPRQQQPQGKRLELQNPQLQWQSPPQPQSKQKQEEPPSETPQLDQTKQRKKPSSFRKRLRRLISRIFNKKA
jgi:hypothetical protein